MVLLGIDYGERQLGLALATGPLAEPLSTLKVTTRVFATLRKLCHQLGVTRVVVGISEGEMAQRSTAFAARLSRNLGLPVVLQDETLSTKEALEKLKEGKGTSKRALTPEHKYAATIILQDYLDQVAPKSWEE